MWICKNNKIDEISINPALFGVHYKKSWKRITLQESLEALKNPSEELNNLARFNAALFLYIKKDQFQTLKEAYNAIVK